MTVLVAINTRDAIILAADSQGTITKPVVDPNDLSYYFDPDRDGKLRTGSDGHPLLDTWGSISSHTLELPYKIHYNVEKIFPLDPLNMGIMASGTSSIGNRTIKSLINDFKATQTFFDICNSEYTLKETASNLLNYLWVDYSNIHNDGQYPEMELMLCGYEKNGNFSGVIRIHVHKNTITIPDFDFCIFFGGITREIQRLLFGIDALNKSRLIKRNNQILGSYHEKLTEFLRVNNINIELPKPKEYGSELALFYNFDLGSLQMNCATYSEQEAIECASFLVNVMINSQKFSNQIPSTGGDVQIAIIQKHTGFQYIAPRQPYLHCLTA